MLLTLGMTFAALLAPFGAVGRWAAAHAVELTSSGVVLILLCRAVPAAAWQRLETGWPRIAAAARFVRALWPDLVKAAKALWSIWYGRPWPFGGPPNDGTPAPYRGPQAVPAPTQPPSGPPMAARVGFGALWLGFVLAVAAVWGGCHPPQLAPVSGCTPRDSRCSDDGVPEVCSGSQRWTRLEEATPCTQLGLVCCRNVVLGPQPLYGCARPGQCAPDPAADAGADAGADALTGGE
jgi:hypothetical protein